MFSSNVICQFKSVVTSGHLYVPLSNAAGPSSSRTNGNEDWSYLEKERDQGSKEKISLHNTKSGSQQKGMRGYNQEKLLNMRRYLYKLKLFASYV